MAIYIAITVTTLCHGRPLKDTKGKDFQQAYITDLEIELYQVPEVHPAKTKVSSGYTRVPYSFSHCYY